MIPEISGPKFGDYETNGIEQTWLAKYLPSLYFYQRVSRIVFGASHVAKKGKFDDEAWYKASLAIRDAFERGGARVQIEGTRHFFNVDGPCVYIGNHMSTAETFLLSSILLPKGRVTFVVKQGLIEYPVFKHIMLSREPIVVGRENPREDLKRVMEDGLERLSRGMSVVIFPQRTRSEVFDAEGFNSIGAKLAKRADVPIIPLALKTNAWKNGKRLKDFGPFCPEESVHFKFGEPLHIEQGTGKVENEAVIRFIQENLGKWDPRLIKGNELS